jgi:site-specific DNA-cytosine methylase
VRVLVACEFSGIVRDAFRARGHDAVSCDLLPTETHGPHIQGDVRDVLTDGWELMVAFPPCTDLSTVNASHWAIKQADGRQRIALELVRSLLLAPVGRIALENPVGRINTALREPDQIIHPWQFGHPWRKRTCIWLVNLPLLRPTEVVTPQGHWVDGGTQTEFKDRVCVDAAMPSGRQRASQRSRTFAGIASAMADQWSAAGLPYQPTLDEVTA